jgi:phage RecT family recombinase
MEENKQQPQTTQPQTTQVAQAPKVGLAAVKHQLSQPAVIESFQKLLGKNANGFISALTTIVGSNDKFKDVDARSVILAAGQSAAMNLPINPSLGMAAVIPYGKVAQMQIMRDGWLDLCLRSGLIATITNEVVYEGELVKADRFRGEYEFDSSKRVSDKVIGFMAYARTTTGYEKTVYMTREEVMAHGQRYSKTFNFGSSLWKTNPESMGLKGLYIKTPIKTYNRGWITMGDVRVGDVVYDGEGRLTNVIAVSERKHRPCYKINFYNGESAVCDDEHNWVVRCTAHKEYYKKSIKEMFEMKANGKSISIETTQQGGLVNHDLPIDPYCLGYWIGNGSKGHAVVTCNSLDSDYVEAKYRAAGFDVNRDKNSENSDTLRISRLDKTGREGGFKKQLERAGLLGNKFVPSEYEFASYEQRMELIRGLLDSDGTCLLRKGGSVRAVFSQEASKLDIVKSLYRLLCSVGEQPSYPRKYRGYGFGKYIESYAIRFTPRTNVFGVPRKAEKLRERFLCNSWGIKSIESIPPKETVCIAVDSPSHTYLCTESQIKTHNTVLKTLIKKYLPKSTEMQKAIESDNMVFTNGEIGDATPTYQEPAQEQKVEEVVVEEAQAEEVKE